MAGPQKQFDRDNALGKALEIFWAKGFEATSMQDLVTQMGINRASLYQTFGNKEALYKQAIAWYCQDKQHSFEQVWAQPGSALAKLETFFQHLMDSEMNGANGCFITNTAVELGPHDADIAEEVRHFWKTLEQDFHTVLQQAKEQGELKAKVDTKAMAKFINTTMQGVLVKVKAGVGATELSESIAMLLAMLRK